MEIYTVEGKARNGWTNIAGPYVNIGPAKSAITALKKNAKRSSSWRHYTEFRIKKWAPDGFVDLPRKYTEGQFND